MNILLLYIICGLLLSIIFRLSNNEKLPLGKYLIIMGFWPLILILVVLDFIADVCNDVKI